MNAGCRAEKPILNVKVPKSEKKNRGRVFVWTFLLGVVAAIGFGVWYVAIRDVEPEENVIQQPTLSVPENDTANDADMSAADDDTQSDAEDANAVAEDAATRAEPTDNTGSELAAPTVVADVERYRLYAFDLEQSFIDFTIKATGTTGQFDLFGHWFEFIYDDDADAWRIVLWFDIDGQSVDTGTALIDEVIRVAFQSERYPVGRFVGESETTIAELETGTEYDVTLVGQLELSGQVRAFEVPLTFTLSDEGVMTVNASLVIDAAEFGADITGGEMNGEITVIAVETDPADLPPLNLPNAAPTTAEDTSE